MTEQTALNPHGNGLAIPHDDEWGYEIEHDVIVVASVKRDAVFGARFDDAADHV